MDQTDSLSYVTLTFKFEQEQDVWVGLCLELGTSTFADSMEDCQSALAELVSDHLNALEEFGERESFFAEHGIQLHIVHPPGYTILESPVLAPPSMVGPYLSPHIFPTGAHHPKSGPLVPV